MRWPVAAQALTAREFGRRKRLVVSLDCVADAACVGQNDSSHAGRDCFFLPTAKPDSALSQLVFVSFKCQCGQENPKSPKREACYSGLLGLEVRPRGSPSRCAGQLSHVV